MSGVQIRVDGATLIVRIPMRFQRRGGRKRIVAPDGSAIVPSSKSQPDGTLVKALARAWRWQRMLDAGIYASVTEISEAEKINKSYVSRILRLALLAPDLVDAILAGRTDQPLTLEQLERPLPASWAEQRTCDSLRRITFRRAGLPVRGCRAQLCQLAGSQTKCCRGRSQKTPRCVAASWSPLQGGSLVQFLFEDEVSIRPLDEVTDPVLLDEITPVRNFIKRL
jgi:hypothetical protein